MRQFLLKPLTLFLFLLTVSQFQRAFAQNSLYPVREWVGKLNSKNDKKNEAFKNLDSLLSLVDSAKIFSFLNELWDKGKSKGYYFHARFNCLKSRQLYLKNIPHNLSVVKEEVKQLFSQAIHEAYESEDEYLIAFVSLQYGGLIYHFGETELSIMYFMNGVELHEKLSGDNMPYNYQSLGELLYKIKEYRESVEYSRKALTAWEKYFPEQHQSEIMSCMNTTALGYHRQKIYDSAFIYYSKALQLADQLKNEVWKGIISGNMGQVFYLQQKYDTARILLNMDYRLSTAAGYYGNAANSLQWSARAELAMGNRSEALKNVREAIRLLNKAPDINYLRNTYYAATQIFEESGAYDSANHYNKLYSELNDSLERVVNLSSIAISRTRLNDEKSRYSIQGLQREKAAQVFQRNILIAGIVLLSIIAFLIVNRQRLKSKLRMEMMMQEKMLMEQNMYSAKEQLKMFTANIIEKTTLIDKLEQQVKNREVSEAQQMMITELSQQTILTEEDWIKFKTLFEKIYPGFFKNLKERYNAITLAEQRMAALVRLQLTIKQVASMLGISVESVHKSRQRLRQRLQVVAENSLEEIISHI